MNAQDRKFHLKPFSLNHHKATMKTGMDALILGAWTQPVDAKSILDIGTGSGIIALMLAAKTKARILGIDLDKDSVDEANSNFKASVYRNRMSAVCEDFLAFSRQTPDKFDFIVSNPPYFLNDMRSQKQKKRQARHTDSLSYEDLISGVKGMLSVKGKFNVILPYGQGLHFRQLAKAMDGLWLHNQLIIFPHRGGQPNRTILQFSNKKTTNPVEEKLIIREEDKNYSDGFNRLLSDYLIGQSN